MNLMISACGCREEGTIDLLNRCDKTTGDCTCKPNIMGSKCDVCKDGFYNYPTNRVFINAVSGKNGLKIIRWREQII